MSLRPHLSFLALLCLLLLAGARQAFGDEIILHNGDRLSGHVVRLQGGKLTLSTDYSDDIEIDLPKIKSVTTDQELELHLAGGEILVGSLIAAEPGTVFIETKAAEEPTRLTWEEIVSITRPRRSWNGSLTVGASVQSGNTERGSASVDGQATWRGNKHRACLRFLFNYAEEDGSLTARNAYAALNHDYFLSANFYSHLGVELLSDEFRDLNLRTVVGPALGYQLWGQDDRSLTFELGTSYFSEDHKDEKDEQWVTARASAMLAWKLVTALSFTDQLVIYPALEKAGQYQLRNDASISSVISASWSVKLSNTVEFDSSPPSGVKEADIFWILGLQHSF